MEWRLEIMEKKNRVPALGELTIVCVCVSRRDGTQKIKRHYLNQSYFGL